MFQRRYEADLSGTTVTLPGMHHDRGAPRCVPDRVAYTFVAANSVGGYGCIANDIIR